MHVHNLTLDENLESVLFEEPITVDGEDFEEEYIPDLILYGLTFFIGFITNAVVLYVIVRTPDLHTITNFYIVNFAIANLIRVLGIPMMLIHLIREWIFGDFMCKMYKGSIFTTDTCKPLLLVVMATDRYIQIRWPSKASQWSTVRQAVKITVVVWMFSAVRGLHAFIFSDSSEEICSIDWDASEKSLGISRDHVDHFDISVSFSFPFYSTSAMFYSLFKRYFRTLEKSGATPESTSRECLQHQDSRNTQEKKYERETIMLLFVIATHFVCSGLVCIVWDFHDHFSMESHDFIFEVCESVITYVISPANPVLYACISKRFYNGLKQICGCKDNHHGRSDSMELLCVEFAEE